MNYDPLAELEKKLDDLDYEHTTNLFDFDVNSAWEKLDTMTNAIFNIDQLRDRR